jgi:hypothetical protein
MQQEYLFDERIRIGCLGHDIEALLREQSGNTRTNERRVVSHDDPEAVLNRPVSGVRAPRTVSRLTIRHVGSPAERP